jgi:hypothetical protein
VVEAASRAAAIASFFIVLLLVTCGFGPQIDHEPVISSAEGKKH